MISCEPLEFAQRSTYIPLQHNLNMSGCILGLFIGLFFIVISAVIHIVRLLSGVRKVAKDFLGNGSAARQHRYNDGRPGRTSYEHNGRGSAGGSYRPDADLHSHRGRTGRFFEKDEGEYIEFEEIREEIKER